ncbi:MAG: hypothetical protein EHM33_17445 [Chloroflexi bacterium]|nr:MAG: hypothetical protein EHM33_17445 [Chloroflexota bacterium]
MRRKLVFSTLWILTLFACNSTPTSVPVATHTLDAPTERFTPHAPTETASVTPTESLTETPAPSETSTPLPSDTALPTVESLKATVTADLLSCRYGPGPEYLYLFAFRASANIELIGRVDAQNWDWVLVENDVPCWVKATFLDVQGDIKSLPIVYPGSAKLPITPYYPRSEVLNAQRNNQTNQITVSWVEVPVSLGDYEDETMQTYIIEVWRCQDGQLIFDPLATRFAYISFMDEPGCSEPSYGRVWVQEKHGYAGPAEIPWPPDPEP